MQLAITAVGHIPGFDADVGGSARGIKRQQPMASGTVTRACVKSSRAWCPRKRASVNGAALRPKMIVRIAKIAREVIRVKGRFAIGRRLPTCATYEGSSIRANWLKR